VSPAYHPELGWLCALQTFHRKVGVVLGVLALLMIVAAILLKPRYGTNNDTAPVIVNNDTAPGIVREADARSDAEPNQTVGQMIPAVTVTQSPHLRSPRAANEMPTIVAFPLGHRAPETSPVVPVDTTGAPKTVLIAPDVTARAGPPVSASRRKVQKPSHYRGSGRDFRYDWNSRDDAWSARSRLYYYPFGRYERAPGW